MPALNYTVFVDKVESGEKLQTIRVMRKRPIKVGDRLYHYHGMRTKKCRKLGESVCTEAITIERIYAYNWCKPRGLVSTRRCAEDYMERIALADGFDNRDDFEDFFDRYPANEVFQIIRWPEIEKP